MAGKNKARRRKRVAKDLAPKRSTQAKGGGTQITGVGPQPSPARTSHPGGINVGMADGSVRLT
jgi:prepilin-type processing-associated H-X9-DG protein